MTAYYNEIDPKAAAWLRELIRAGVIAGGDVDERSIVDVRPADLAGYRQCHFFAGIGVWSYALRAAGWRDDEGVWTGSCPCQPFSTAGGGAGFEDERHLWPSWFTLIRECRPGVVFGEQVAGKDGLAWLDLVQPDMEDAGYAFAAIDLCAAGFGAPHIRQRLFFVANSSGESVRGRSRDNARTPGEIREEVREQRIRTDDRASGDAGAVAHSAHNGLERGKTGSEARAECAASRGREEQGCWRDDDADGRASLATGGFWRNAEWLPCLDGKARPVEPGTSPLVTGAPARVVRLRGYGNSINAEVARAFIEAYRDVRGE